MSLKTYMLTLAMLTTLVATPASAQDSAAAESSLDAAEQAIEAGDWQAALEALERAYLTDPDPYYLYRRILVLEEMGERELALAVLEENRAAMAASDRVRDLALLEERLRAPAAVDPATTDPATGSSGGPSIPLLVSGGVLTVGGAVLWAVGAGQAAKLRCSAAARPDDSCDGTSGAPLTETEYRSAAGRAKTLGIIGIGTTVAGLGLSTIAFVLGRSGESEDRSSAQLTFVLSTHPQVGFRWTF